MTFTAEFAAPEAWGAHMISDVICPDLSCLDLRERIRHASDV